MACYDCLGVQTSATGTSSQEIDGDVEERALMDLLIARARRFKRMRVMKVFGAVW